MPRYASLNSPLMPKTLCDLRTFVTAGLARSIPIATLLNPRVSWPCHTFGLAPLLSQSRYFPMLALAGLTLDIDVIAHRPTPTRRTPEPDTEAGT